jgi:deoxycytidylate deaminase
MISNKDFRWMAKAEKRARHVPKCASAKVSAILVLKNREIATGCNSYRTHPLAAKYGKNSQAICIHAELDTILKATKKIEGPDFNLATLYICRVKSKNQDERHNLIWGIACPCEGCASAIAHYGVRRVVYSLDGEDRRFEIIE